MMGWEGPLMVHHAALICGDGGKDVMNVGFGLGLVDAAIQVRGDAVCSVHLWAAVSSNPAVA